MNKQQKDNSGAFFQNDNTKNPKAPNYRGKATVEGKAYDVAIWKQTSRDGKPYFSMKFQEPWKKEDQGVEEAF